MTQIACKQPTIKSEDERKLLVYHLNVSRHPLKQVISMCLDERKERRPNARMLCASLQYACASLANATGDQDMDSIAKIMQQLCLERQSGEWSGCCDLICTCMYFCMYFCMYLRMCAYYDTYNIF